MARQVGDNGKSKASGRARDVVKGAQILELVASGITVSAAAGIVGCSRHHASQLYQRELAAHMERNSDLRRGLIAQDLETLRLLVQAHMPPAIGKMIAVDGDGYEVDEDGSHVDLRQVVIQPPSAQSAKIVLAALDRRARLLGLDSAIRVEVSAANVNTALAEVLELDARRLS
jgi:hypothetical protein